jgi:hypothetical protein
MPPPTIAQLEKAVKEAKDARAIAIEARDRAQIDLDRARGREERAKRAHKDAKDRGEDESILEVYQRDANTASDTRKQAQERLNAAKRLVRIAKRAVSEAEQDLREARKGQRDR